MRQIGFRVSRLETWKTKMEIEVGTGRYRDPADPSNPKQVSCMAIGYHLWAFRLPGCV